MEIDKLKDAELFNVALMLSDWQQHILTEIKSRPSMSRLSPIVASLDMANVASNRTNELILQVMKFDMACQFGEKSDKILDKVIPIILVNNG